MCKVFENRSLQDEERMDQLTNQLKEARLLAEDADGKSDEVMASVCMKFLLTQIPVYPNQSEWLFCEKRNYSFKRTSCYATSSFFLLARDFSALPG
jgi:hypothetical protein